MGFKKRSEKRSRGPIGQASTVMQRVRVSRWLPAAACLAVARRFTVLAFGVLMTAVAIPTGVAVGQLSDPLDAYPPRFKLAGSDCGARVTAHTHEATGGLGSRGCESLTILCGNGTQAMLEYRIEPCRVIDELTARLFVKSVRKGLTIGLRVRFPKQLDPETGQSLSVVVAGAGYRDAGSWQQLGIGMIEQPLAIKTFALRQSLGPTADLSDPFVDAVVINAYGGPGETTLKLDNLTIDAMVPVVSMRSLAQSIPAGGPAAELAGVSGGGVTDSPTRRHFEGSPFPAGGVTRILEHNGEPLGWVRSLGFDAILLAKPFDHAILSEAMRAGVKVYSPPPSNPDPALVPLLEPLAGYYLGTSMSLHRLQEAREAADRVRRWPAIWQRPVILAPAEGPRKYASIADSLVLDLPSPIRGLSADEESALLRDIGQGWLLGGGAVGVQADVPSSLRVQLDAISGAIGAPRGPDFFPHALLLQVARSLSVAPRAIIFRSTSPLTSGRPEDHSRSLAVAYANRYLESVRGLVAAGKPASPLVPRGADYEVNRLQFPGGELIIATTRTRHRGLVLAGDGGALRIELPTDTPNPLAWRVTHFAAERLTVQRTSGGASLELISPDVVETIVLGGDATTGGRLSTALAELAATAAVERLQLTRELVDRAAADWSLAASARAIPADSSGSRLVEAARSTLSDGEPLIRTGEAAQSLRMARRADAWALRSQWQLHAALSPGGRLDPIVSSPPLLAASGVPMQVVWGPLMGEVSWGDNLLVGGSLDTAQLLGDAGWVVGRRPELAGEVEAKVGITQGPQVEGEGCLVASVVGVSTQSLPGGYAGTTLQIRSPAVRLPANRAIRIEARLRTLGFGGPDQGVLVHDSIAGPELGVLVRATPQWQTVRLYRQSVSEGEVRVLFELLGAGEVAIDDVQIRPWDPKPGAAPGDPAGPQIPLRPLGVDEPLPAVLRTMPTAERSAQSVVPVPPRAEKR